MIHGCVTLDEVFAAAWVRAASLVPETSGYLALAVCDATSRLPFAVDERLVMLTTEGSVGITKRGALLPPKQATEGLRTILARLLAVSTGTAMPGLSGAARPRDESDRGVEAFVEEIEAALIPVNRGAARRALARLARETIKAREQGRLKRPSTRPPPQPAAAAAPRPQPAPVFMQPPQPAPVVAPPPQPAPIVAKAPPVAAEPPPQPVEPPRDLRGPGAWGRSPQREPAVPAASAPDRRRQPVVVAPIVAIEPVDSPIAAQAVTPPPVGGTRPELAYRDPTPTVLGIGVVELHDMEPQTTLDVVTEGYDLAASPEDHLAAEPQPEPAALPEPTALPESTVLAQPTEDPALAFGLDVRTETLTPPFSFGVEPRSLPATAPTAPTAPTTAAPRLIQIAEPSASCAPPTRADDLLARFGTASVDDQRLREAAAGLRRIAGVDPLSPQPARVEIRLLTPPAPPAHPHTFSADWETPETPRTREKRRAAGTSLGLAIAVLLAGVAGGGAVVRYRPDLFGAIRRLAAPAPAVTPAPVDKEAPPPPAPSATVDPSGAVSSPHGDRLGGTRAERSSPERANGQRAR